MSLNKIFETERLILREFTFDDAAFVLKLVNTPDWIKFIGDRNIHSIAEANEYLENGPMASYRDNGYGLSAVLLKDNNTLIGMCGLVNRPTTDYIDIGFALLPEYLNRGYAYEIASATMRYANNELGITRVVATTDARNTSSIKLLNKLGLQFEKSVNLDVNDSAIFFSPPQTSDDLKEIDALTLRFFSLFTNTNGAIPNVADIKNIFVPEGIIISNTGDKCETFSLQSFIEPREKMLSDGTLSEFSEREISHNTDIFGNIAQRFCLYEKSGILNGVTFETRGMKTLQLVKVNKQWKMSSVAWSDE